MASPTPLENQVIWHHIVDRQPVNQDGELDWVDYDVPPPGSFVLQAGQMTDDGRFEALPLNITDHEVLAALVVNDPGDDMLEGQFYLEVQNEYGSQNYTFSFAKMALITTPNPYEAVDDSNTSTLGSGTIAAIVVIIVAILVAVGITSWAKKNNKWCFAKPDYNPTATSDPDPNQAPIIKSSEASRKPETTVVIKQEQKVENSV